ncbi:TetR/AcrR family transcriptional regulator [Nocardioides litoris]|uniref:TetR/AcrR family transcriptional regulator n=1 Tax=Nocardioides litoris TaxID=1926648 RepID=UPI0011222047|nr:TetR/AcrR family transcriptional regulator [Nocardioides litoris]
MTTRESTRTRLLDAAEDVLFVDGAADAPVDRILERAGVSPATLYRAYGSKEDLVAAALDRRFAAWIDTWDAAVARATDDRGRLLAVLDALGEFHAGPRGARWCAFLGTAAEHPDPPPALAAAVRQDSDALRTRLLDLSRPVAGERAPDLAEELLLVVTGHLALRLRPGRRPPGLAVARRVAEALVDRASGAG